MDSQILTGSFHATPERAAAARGMDPIRRLAFRVMIQAVEDAGRGAQFQPSELATLSDWARVAGLAEHRLSDTIESARAGKLPSLKHLFPGSDHKNLHPVEDRIRQFLTAAG